MGARIPADWEAIKGLYLRGYGPSKIAEATGLKEDTIKKRISRGGWRQIAEAVDKQTSSAVLERTLSDAKTHVTRTIRLLDQQFDHLEALITQGPAGEETAEYRAKILDRLDQIGRRAHGIDAQADRKAQFSVNVQVNTAQVERHQPVVESANATIDVESEHIPTPPDNSPQVSSHNIQQDSGNTS